MATRIVNIGVLYNRALKAEEQREEKIQCTPGEILALLEISRGERNRADNLENLIVRIFQERIKVDA